ncbi:MAG TPA: tetratricopeptide repeat protein [Myxococcales bacterium]|nr:tetratricopeptide repeat protein [Myxococcales bacterium]
MNRLALAAAVSILACKPSMPAPPRAAAADAGAGLDTRDPKALMAEVDRLGDQLRNKPKSFEVLSALGSLYYENKRYLEAVDTFRQAEEIAAPVEEEADALRKKGVKPAGELPAECRRSGPDYGLVQIAAAAKKLDPPRRLRCLDSALEMARADRAKRGDCFYLIGNPDAALAEHRKVLERSPDYPESLFFVGAILLEQSNGDGKMIAEGKKNWQRLLEVAPDSPRASIVRDTLPRADELFKARPDARPAQGNPPGSPTQQGGEAAKVNEPSAEEMRNMEEAVQNTQRTPELEKGLDQLLVEGERDLDQGKYQDARDAVVRVMPMRPNDARTSAAMGGAMRGLGRMEMARRTLEHALQLDPNQPRALYEMGKLQAQEGDKAAAAKTFAQLKSSDPKFARAHKVDEELAKLR